MKTIVISGAHSGVGKTTLCNALGAMLPGSHIVKIGHGAPKANGPMLYPHGTTFSAIARDHASAAFLIIESNAILSELDPTLAIYLEGGGAPKPSAALAQAKAHIRSHTVVTPKTVTQLAAALTLPPDVVRTISWLAGARPEPATAIILAGGKSSRMGSDKARMDIGGTSAVQNLYAILKGSFDEVCISVGPAGPVYVPEVRHIADELCDQGPLAGMLAALTQSTTRVNFIMACDIPAVFPPVLRTLLSLSEKFNIAVPSFKPNTVEPLFGMYSRTVIPAIESLLASNKRKVAALFPLCKTRIVKCGEAAWYANLNTPQDRADYYTRTKAPR